MTISAHDLLHDAGLFHRTYPNWPHAEPEPEAARYRVDQLQIGWLVWMDAESQPWMVTEITGAARDLCIVLRRKSSRPGRTRDQKVIGEPFYGPGAVLDARPGHLPLSEPWWQ